MLMSYSILKSISYTFVHFDNVLICQSLRCVFKVLFNSPWWLLSSLTAPSRTFPFLMDVGKFRLSYSLRNSVDISFNSWLVIDFGRPVPFLSDWLVSAASKKRSLTALNFSESACFYLQVRNHHPLPPTQWSPHRWLWRLLQGLSMHCTCVRCFLSGWPIY